MKVNTMPSMRDKEIIHQLAAHVAEIAVAARTGAEAQPVAQVERPDPGASDGNDRSSVLE